MIALTHSTTQEDELDSALQWFQPEGPQAIVPEGYHRAKWITRYIEDVIE